MEEINFFEILLDISDRTHMVDYMKDEVCTKDKNGHWNLHDMLKDYPLSPRLENNDENAYLRVSLMDSAITDGKWPNKGLLGCVSGTYHEAVLGVPNSDDSPKLPSRILPLYEPGDVVCGTVFMDLNKPLDVKSVAINFLGKARVNVRSYHQFGKVDAPAEETYINETLYLWVNSKQKLGQGQSYPFQTGKELPAGKHEFPFQFKLPSADKLCGSIPQLIPTSFNYCYVMYRLKAVLDVEKRDDLQVYKGIWLEKPFVLNEYPDLLKKLTAIEILDTGVVQFWKAGKVTCQVKLERSGYLRGEDIPVDIEISNITKSEIEKVTAKVVLHGVATAGAGQFGFRIPIKAESVKVSTGPVGAETSAQFQLNVPLDFAESSVNSCMIPVGEMRDCSLIAVSYNLQVKVKRKGLHRDIVIHIPITIGNKI